LLKNVAVTLGVTGPPVPGKTSVPTGHPGLLLVRRHSSHRHRIRQGAGTIRGFVHSYESAGTLDGPGIRFVLFTAGCPLRCQYCHNPDTQAARNGRRTKVDEVVTEICSYRDVLMGAGGGVTVSGGEPLAQPQFVTEVLRRCRALGLHTAVDTSGYSRSPVPDALLQVTDLFLLDLKSSIPEIFRKVTGKNLTPSLSFARRLAALSKPVWLRFVLVPGLTDAPENIAGVAQIAASLGNVRRVEVLPFHQMGKEKYMALSRPYPLADTRPPTPEELEAARSTFRGKGLTVS
jgi:pyruvate formate lyase activating enzyme